MRHAHEASKRRAAGKAVHQRLVPPLHAAAVDDDTADDDAEQDKKACTVMLAGKNVVRRAEPIRAKLAKCIQVPALRDQADLLSTPPGGRLTARCSAAFSRTAQSSTNCAL
jgi:hypothetical protein